MSFGGLILAMTAVQAISQIGQGKVAKAEANYNATLVEGEANMIGAQQEIEYGQYERLKGRTLSQSVNAVAGQGVGLGGSAMAVMLKTQKEIGIDQAIGQFNLEQQKQYKLNEAGQIRRYGAQAARTGYTNAFSTLLTGVSNYGMYKGWGQDMGGGGISNKGNIYGSGTPKGTIDTGSWSKFYHQ